MRLLRALPLLLAAALPLAAEDVFAPPVAVPTGAPGTVTVEGADAVLRVADAPWLDRELVRFAAALGRDPRPLRRWLAETVYHTRSLDAIDTARPALFMWRKGEQTLQAIIPIRADSRRQFVDEFGVMPVGEPPLVRTGDRDGTVVFTQNHASGLREYRLLVMDSVAFLGRNADECRRLAARMPVLLPPTAAGSAPLSLTCTGDWLRANRMLDWSWSARLPVPQWLPWPQVLDVAQAAAVAQLDGAAFELRGGGNDARARLTARFVARPDSDLAAWIASQQNQANRFQSQLVTPATAIRIAGHIAWQDKLEVLARALVRPLAQQHGGRWTPVVEEAWLQAFAVAERASDLVWKLDVPQKDGQSQFLGQIQTLALEQPRADEQFQLFDRIAAALLGVEPGPGVVGGAQSASRERAAGNGLPALRQVLAATTRHVLVVDGWDLPLAATQASAEDSVKRLQQVASTPGEAALATLWVNVGRLVMLAPRIDTEVAIPDAVVQGVLRSTAVNAVQFDLSVPLVSTAQALSHLPDERAEKKDADK